jgi:uncharacterized protein (DUF885 family)
MVRAVLTLAVVACSSPPKTSMVAADDAPTRFDDLAHIVSSHLHRFDPAEAVSLGLHDFDGLLPDRSPHAREQEIAQLRKDRDALRAADDLAPHQQLERDVLLQAVRAQLFHHVEKDSFRTNPMTYMGAVNLDAYIIRDYAPKVRRAAAVITLCTGLPAYLAQARTNLMTPMPRSWIDTALIQTRGYHKFVDVDVRQDLSAVDIPLANQAEIEPAIETCKAALAEHVAWLEREQPRGSDAYALGRDRYLAMLAETQGIETDLARLTAIAEADLDRNLRAMTEAARAIDPKRSVAEVVAMVAADKPAANAVVELATRQATDMRAFVVANKIASIPTPDVAIVRESPPFRRWNIAFLDRAGPFEDKPLPSYYYISLPDPAWTADEQLAYIPARNDLLFITIHEVWPGHFLHGLKLAKHPSRVMKSRCTSTTTEGWAHYAEEMMFEAGAGGDSPRTRVAMLKNALLRNVRFVVALGEHTGGMTVEQATKRFETQAFTDPATARQQAVRGTFDPMYLAYTLGKIIIKTLRHDWMQKHPGASLGEFHDELLSHGCAPLPLIRRAMLGPDAGGPL